MIERYEDSSTIDGIDGEQGGAWHLLKEELQPESLRKLGLLLYTLILETPRGWIITEIQAERLDELEKAVNEGKIASVTPQDMEAGASEWRQAYRSHVEAPIPANRYVDTFVHATGVNRDMLSRWLDTVSRELAASCLPLVQARERKDPFARLPGSLVATDLQAAQAVLQRGLSASLDQHRWLIGVAGHFGVPAPFSPA